MNDNYPILAIETSGLACGVSLYFSDEKFFSSTINLKHSHSEKLFEIIEFLFEQAGNDRNQIRFVAVSVGPGSFTGLRVGLAAAKGIARASGCPIIGVPTFEALAYELSFYSSDESEIIISNKVNNEEVYYAKFKISPNNYIFTDPLTILPIDKLKNIVKGIKLYGNSAKKNYGTLNNSLICSPSPQYVAKWALIFGKDKLIFDYDFYEPIYIKNFIVKEKQSK
jgi:tRNA threonylcarbamoyladenosine biosynthesis protein TsaB